MPMESDASELYMKSPFPLSICNMSRSKPIQKSEFNPESLLPIYSNDMSSLIYSVSERNDLNECFISKNESAFAHFREANKLLNSSFQSMKESFAIL